MPIDGKGSYIASLTLINTTCLLPSNLHTRIGRRIAAKTKRTPELVREGFMRLSPVAIPMADGYILGVNLTKLRLWEWAKQSRIQSFVFITFDENGEMVIEHYGSETHLPMEVLNDNAVINALREVNQKIEHKLKKSSSCQRVRQTHNLGLSHQWRRRCRMEI